MKSSNKILASVLLMALSFAGLNPAKAQQDPMFTYYLQNPVALNPAVAGTISGLNMSLLTRHQWLGIDGRPASYSFGAHTPYIKQNMGLGLNISTDQAGPMRFTNFTASYAYKITLVEGLELSMGLKAGVSSYNAKIGGLQVNDPGDPNFAHDDKWITPNLGVGFYAFAENYYAGFSIPRLVEVKLNKEYRESGQPYNPQLYLMGGYKFQINRDWDISPSSLIGIMGGSPLSVDIMGQVEYLKRIQFGTHYRIGDALGLFVSGNVYDNFIIGYAFDFSLNKLSGMNSGTHEIILTYRINDIWNNVGDKWKF